jgi:tRNA pseudouridine38-40 synthase
MGNVAGQGIQYSKEEIDAEERRPKRKVAVLIGYSGTGYKGMQISGTERTIEGDLFQAFIRAGAISKANAEDPKKSSLVRCARTDKGVHAAGNMISLKLIVEDKDIVEKINAELSPQIRVWGIERTVGSFSCYQACDSRWYEYLIPSHAFLPPHPSSWLAKQLEQFADEANDRANYESRQKDIESFWQEVEESEIKPILESIDEDLRWEVVKALQGEEEASAKAGKNEDDPPTKPVTKELVADEDLVAKPAAQGDGANPTSDQQLPSDVDMERVLRLRAATKRLRNAYVGAKRRYRIPPSRIDRIQTALDKYIGTKNYHNYTILKTFKDPSVKRHIKSFVVNKKPILIGEGADETKSEWLSLKVHGQSFMMHQIRKMVGMVTLMVRSGADMSAMDTSFTEARFSIPKVPGLGLLLERPVFDSYNSLQAAKHGREALRFDKYEEKLEAFKESEIYQRIFREEEERNEFGRFFNHIDNFKEPWFLYVTSMGLQACKGYERKAHMAEVDGSDGEQEDN